MNYDLKEKIRDYWSARAAGFDASFSHSILAGVELEAWKHRYASLVGTDALNVLELGSGTGEISKVLHSLGHTVTGIDFSETMQALAKIKHADHAQVSYVLGDAEQTHQEDHTYDLVTCRHLVWTLLEPEAALADWFRVTKPGGHLVIFDGNFVAPHPQDKWARRALSLLDKVSPQKDQQSAEMRALQDEIKAGFFFSKGLSFDHLAELVTAAGYVNVARHSYEPIRRAQRKIVRPYSDPRNWLRTFMGDRFVLYAQKR